MVATRTDIMTLLTASVRDVFSALGLGVRDAQLSAPTDGRPRIAVAIRPGIDTTPPAAVRMKVNGREVEVPVEVTGNFQAYSAY